MPLVEKFRAPHVYMPGPDTDWREKATGIKPNPFGWSDSLANAQFAYKGPKYPANGCEEAGANEQWVTERCWSARESDVVFAYMPGCPLDYLTIAEVAFAVAHGRNVTLAIGPVVSSETVAALEFLGDDVLELVADDSELAALFEATLRNCIKWEDRRYFVEVDDEAIEKKEAAAKAATAAE